MANKTLFKSSKTPSKVKLNPNKWVESVNEAGGASFSMPDKLALAQYAVTGTFNNVFYASAEDQLQKVQELALKVDSEFIAKLAVYSRNSAFMKDMPAFLLAVLHARNENELLGKVFNKVITSFKMLSNFVQIVRSGVLGRKSFGSFTKNLVKNWLENKNALEVFNGSIGLSNPSVSDIVKMVHPKADSKAKDAVYAYVTDGKDLSSKMRYLPDDLRLFEKLKRKETLDGTEVLPNIPFRALTNLKLSTDQWYKIALNMPYNTLRQNLNMLSERGVFENTVYVNALAEKLRDAETIKAVKLLPYQLFTTYLNTVDLPQKISLALQDAAEVATENVPSFDGETVVLVDVSGSMSSPITGHRYGTGTPASKMTCVHVASLMASCVLRKNQTSRVIMFDTRVHHANLNPRDSLVTNAQTIAKFGGGGTDLNAPLVYLNSINAKYDNIIYVSDNMSWMGRQYGSIDSLYIYSKRVPNVRLVNIDIQPYAHTQLPDGKNVFNVGGFSDTIWTSIAKFLSREENVSFVDEIEKSVRLS